MVQGPGGTRPQQAPIAGGQNFEDQLRQGLSNPTAAGLQTADQQALGSASTSMSFNSNSQVWLGKRNGGGFVPGIPANPTIARSRYPLTGPRADTYMAAMDLPFQWSEKELRTAMAGASAALGTQITSFSQFMDKWKDATKYAAQSWRATGGKNPLTPWDAFALLGTGGAGGAGGGAPASQARTIVEHQRTINRLSDGGAWAIIKSAAQQALGRAPTHDEVRQFAARANTIAVNNPSTATITRRTDARGDVVSTSTSAQDGAGAGDFQQAAEKKVDTPEAGAYQAASTYYSAMLSGLNSVV